MFINRYYFLVIICIAIFSMLFILKINAQADYGNIAKPALPCPIWKQGYWWVEEDCALNAAAVAPNIFYIKRHIYVEDISQVEGYDTYKVAIRQLEGDEDLAIIKEVLAIKPEIYIYFSTTDLSVVKTEEKGRYPRITLQTPGQPLWTCERFDFGWPVFPLDEDRHPIGLEEITHFHRADGTVIQLGDAQQLAKIRRFDDDKMIVPKQVVTVEKLTLGTTNQDIYSVSLDTPATKNEPGEIVCSRWMANVGWPVQCIRKSMPGFGLLSSRVIASSQKIPIVPRTEINFPFEFLRH